MFRGELLCLSLYTLPLVLSLGTSEKSLALPSLYCPFKYLYILLRSPPSLLFSLPGEKKSQQMFVFRLYFSKYLYVLQVKSNFVASNRFFPTFLSFIIFISLPLLVFVAAPNLLSSGNLIKLLFDFSFRSLTKLINEDRQLHYIVL